MSKWGHPVFTIGWTPYDSINTGHGNVPGGPGFIPGYGYYPGAAPDHYPWMDGPGTPFDRRKLMAPLSESWPAMGLPAPGLAEEVVAPETALIVVKIPAEAKICFDGTRTEQEGSYRRFATPPLPPGQAVAYTLEARWRIKDVELTRTEKVVVMPGQIRIVNFLTTDSWEGRRLSPVSQRAIASQSAR